jgi:mannosyltransferase
MVDLLPSRVVPSARAGALLRDRWMRLRTSSAFAPLAVGAIALVATGALSWVPSPWYDEAATISAATRSLPQLLHLLQNVDAVHGAYYLFMHAWFELVGYSPFTLRLPSTIAIGLTAALLVVLVRRLASRRTAVVAGLVFVLMPRVTWMATEGRSYAITALLAVLLTLVFLVASSWSGRDRTQRILIWTVYALLAALAGAVFLYLTLLVLAHGVSAVLLAVARRDRTRAFRRVVIGWFVAAVAVALTLISLALDSAAQSHQVQWIAPLDARTLNYVLTGQFFIGNRPFAILGLSLFGLGAAVLIARVLGSRRASGRTGGPAATLAAVVLPWVLVPTLALLLESSIATPLYSPRYLTFAAPAVAVVIAVALTAGRRRWIAPLALVVLLALTVPSWVHQRSPEGKQSSSWGEVAALIASERAAEPPGIGGSRQVDAAIYGPLRNHPDADMAMLALAYPQQFAGLTDLKAGESAGDLGKLWAGRIPLAETHDRLEGTRVVWMITSDKRDWRPGVSAQLAAWGYHHDAEWHFTGINVVRYLRG